MSSSFGWVISKQDFIGISYNMDFEIFQGTAPISLPPHPTPPVCQACYGLIDAIAGDVSVMPHSDWYRCELSFWHHCDVLQLLMVWWLLWFVTCHALRAGGNQRHGTECLVPQLTSLKRLCDSPPLSSLNRHQTCCISWPPSWTPISSWRRAYR